MYEYISREEAIKELREVYENEYPTASGDFDEYASHDVPNVLRNIPSADVQPVNRWISVKDRLPENCIEVLVYDTDCGIVIGWYDKEIGDFAADFISPLDAVTHWIPLPEPPKDGDTE